MRRMSWKVLAIIVVAIWLLPIFIASWLNRPYPSKPLPLKLVTWKEIGRVEGCTDFDGDGNDELVVKDKQSQWWSVWWDKGKCKREKLPVPKDFSFFLSHLHFPSYHNGVFGDGQKFLKVRFVDGKWQVKKVVLKEISDEEIGDWYASLGWQRIEQGAYVALADVDGDERLDKIKWERWEGKLTVKTAKGAEWKKQKPGFSLWVVKDLDGDGKVELVSEEPVGNGNWRVVCWYFDTEARKWRSDSVQMPFVRLGNLEGLCEFFMDSVFAVKQKSGFALIGLTFQRQRTQIWKLVWQRDRWRKEFFDEFEGKGLPIFTGQDWLAFPSLEPPQWWLWIREKVNELMERLNFDGLPSIDLKMRLIGRTGKGKWVTLIRFKESELQGLVIADFCGDGLKEIALILRHLDDSSVYVGKFVSGQWWLGKEKLPDEFVPYDRLGKNFRYRGINWALWQDENNRCVAVTVKH